MWYVKSNFKSFRTTTTVCRLSRVTWSSNWSWQWQHPTRSLVKRLVARAREMREIWEFCPPQAILCKWRLTMKWKSSVTTWEAGPTFVQRGFYEDDNYDQRTVHIRAGRESFMSWVWGSVFGLLDENNFLVTDFQLEPSRSQVVFHGYYYCRYSGKRRTFKSTFQFSATSFYVRVRAEEKFVNGTEAGFRESCFQKPDPTGWLQHWDDQFHDPPFIQSTLDYLTQEVWS